MKLTKTRTSPLKLTEKSKSNSTVFKKKSIIASIKFKSPKIACVQDNSWAEQLQEELPDNNIPVPIQMAPTAGASSSGRLGNIVLQKTKIYLARNSRSVRKKSREIDSKQKFNRSVSRRQKTPCLLTKQNSFMNRTIKRVKTKESSNRLNDTIKEAKGASDQEPVSEDAMTQDETPTEETKPSATKKTDKAPMLPLRSTADVFTFLAWATTPVQPQSPPVPITQKLFKLSHRSEKPPPNLHSEVDSSAQLG